MAKYQRKSRLFPVALSPQACADALDIRYQKIRDAIDASVLPAFKHGNQIRILVSDLEEWVRRHWNLIN